MQSLYPKYNLLIFTHETYTILNQNCDMILVQNCVGFVSENEKIIFCVERLNILYHKFAFKWFGKKFCFWQ